jgi:hypothetical protein
VANTDKLALFTSWSQQHIKGDEKGEAQIFLDRLFQAFDQQGCLDVGGTPEFRIRKSDEDGGGTAFADYNCVRRLCLETDCADRNEEARREFAKTLSPGV